MALFRRIEAPMESLANRSYAFPGPRQIPRRKATGEQQNKAPSRSTLARSDAKFKDRSMNETTRKRPSFRRDGISFPRG
jgi:hypothetical protein